MIRYLGYALVIALFLLTSCSYTQINVYVDSIGVNISGNAVSLPNALESTNSPQRGP